LVAPACLAILREAANRRGPDQQPRQFSPKSPAVQWPSPMLIISCVPQCVTTAFTQYPSASAWNASFVIVEALRFLLAKPMDSLPDACAEYAMQFRHLKTFAAVASTLNITRAARKVHLTQSSVSEQIQALEADLGARLFDRTRRGLRLTEAGQRLLDHATPLLALADEAKAAVADAVAEPRGSVTAGGLETLCATHVPPLLASFGKAYPAIALALKSAGSGDLRAGVRSGGLDIAFIFGGPPVETELASETVAEESIAIIAPRGHRLVAKPAITPQDLDGERFLVTETGCVYRRMFDDMVVAARAAPPRIAGEFGSLAAIGRMVQAGAGCALVPRLAVPEEVAAAVAILPWAGAPATVPIAMIWRKRRVHAPALRLFLTAAREHFSAITPGGARPRHAAPCP